MRLDEQASGLNFIKYEAFDHVTLWVGNAKQAAHFYCSTLGFEPLAYRGLENGSRDIVSHVVCNDNAVFCFMSALKPGNKEFGEFLERHGDGVRDISFTVDNAKLCYETAIARGATSVKEPHTLEDKHGSVVIATISLYDGTHHSFIERKNYSGPFLPGYTRSIPNKMSEFLPKVSVNYIDHCVSNQPDSKMLEVCEKYENVLGFHRFWSVDDKDIHTQYSSLRSTVMADEAEHIKMPINEPANGLRKSQIEEFVEYYGGPGIQHIALNVDDVITTVTNLVDRGCDFLPTPKSYYENLRERLAESADRMKIKVTEDISVLEKLNILVDYDENGYLLQIFTKPLQDRPTLFIEFIQRKNHNGFGAGNFKSLFESIEREQEKRGNL
ncbi:4-hydroxyphenylpyruvate dioxygenase [Zancudomyces culisetae]|uniref:4-hydroxyphenylpyruvate dioxygenase n=1 Tax=Zancudomyces culisetae TaxID=1213189 RepID=A0A1R1PPT9_ZANCU|nr:4-hydroxyphenylpyruvate dioxygenase [Zancudomyces culisetae]|eukprot:OMH82984.1 4-hydroxyphenylpyruvate dioxygenase [Zancudomyces culisetae]